MNRFRRLLAVGCLLGSAAGLAGAQAPTIRLCAEDEDAHPWLLQDGRGLNQEMLRKVEQRLGLRFSIERQPWRRCLQSLRNNQVDGAFKASFSAERQEFAHYPMRDGRVDPSRRMLDERYYLYRRLGASVTWDGQTLATGGRPVGAQAGFSIVPWLAERGVQVDDGTRHAEAVLAKLMNGRIGAAALQAQQAEHLLKRNPAWAAELERLEPPLLSKPYYLLLSRAWVAREPALAERVWNTIATVRESADYRRLLMEAE